MKITTNNHQRPIIYWNDLPESAQNEYDYLADNGSSFVKYKGLYYCFDEFLACKDGGIFNGWHGYHSETAFSGIVVKHCIGGSTVSVIVGTFVG